MSDVIPFGKLGIPSQIEKNLERDAPRPVKLAIARGLLPMPTDAQLGALYVLASDPDAEVSELAVETARGVPLKQVVTAVGPRTHAKVLEFLIEFREPDFELDERVGMLRVTNDRTATVIAARADKALCEKLCNNHERLLMTPGVFLALHANPNCKDVDIERAGSFLRMQRQLPELPPERPFKAAALAALGGGGDSFIAEDGPAPTPSGAAAEMDLMAEIEAALRGERSPAFIKAAEQGLDMFVVEPEAPGARGSRFEFNFKDDSDVFSWNLTADGALDEAGGEAVRLSLEAKIAEMTIGQKIKLAYLGNKESRKVLLRDSNKMVASAVIKSGRLTDNEVLNVAGNKNLDGDVLREVAMNGEWTRKYPVKVALVNNPKTPVSLAVSMVSQLQKKDLQSLLRNRNISSVVSQAATRLFKQRSSE